MPQLPAWREALGHGQGGEAEPTVEWGFDGGKDSLN